ncbi:uncharacterized protein FIESC28_05039 [Fusarium coffeatum]|uniref:mannan endo-1,6-alpha-mannosidase n=1 Tax=Fusarium coffeatum TaxID=231269 RepID=A0A366RUY6_9HYPO|nr:uncharacterized protein FIESC28_05039 [Fusarium coffeatum]RBR20887.1 hypothetical protein FIESC28_05039 [Fusarium coffeatum]
MVVLKNIAGLALLLAQSATVQSMDLDSREGILDASKALAGDLIEFYKGNKTGETPGLLDPGSKLGDGYYWYQSGAFMSAYVDYWQLTGDDTYNDLVREGLEWQVGKDKDFMPTNQSTSMGNDDQAIWAMAAMSAAEYGFPAPTDKKTQWYDVAKNAWDMMRERWDIEDNGVCYGGLRWQIFQFNTGYDYKSTLSNTLFLNLGARIDRFAESAAVADYVTMAYSWLEMRELIDDKTSAVYDGTHTTDNCTTINKVQWSANAASLSMGLAYVYNKTGNSGEPSMWKDAVEEIATMTLKTFFTKEGKFKEVACSKDTCPPDILTYKALTHRWLAVTAQLAPFLSGKIMPVLRKSAKSLQAEGNGKDALEQKLANFAVVSNLLIADGTAPMKQKDAKTKTEEDSSDATSSATDSATGSATSTSAAAEATVPEDSSAKSLAGSGSALALSLLVAASQWLL